MPAQHERKTAEHQALGHRLRSPEHRPDPVGQILVISHASLRYDSLTGQGQYSLMHVSARQRPGLTALTWNAAATMRREGTPCRPRPD